jgi:hypothetical protein
MSNNTETKKNIPSIIRSRKGGIKKMFKNFAAIKTHLNLFPYVGMKEDNLSEKH